MRFRTSHLIGFLYRSNDVAKSGEDSRAQGKLTLYFMLRASSMIISILSLPFILNNIGSVSFARVSILLTLFQFITILDWGLGNFIISRFTPIFQSGKLKSQSEFTTKFLPMLLISNIVLVTLVFLVDRMSVLKLAFSLGNGLQYEARVYLFYTFCLINLVLLCLSKMLLVLNKRDMYQITLSLNVAFPQLVILGASFVSFSSIDLVLLYQVSSSLVYLFGLLNILENKYSIRILHSYLKLSLKPNSRYLLFLFRSSYRFFILQLIGFVTSQAGVLIVAQFSGTQQVAEYSIIMRILGVHIAFVTFIFGSSQSEINQILKTKSLKFLKKFFISVYLFSAISIVSIFTVLILFRENVFFLKIVGGTVFSSELVLTSLVYIVVWSINYPFSIVAVSDFPSKWYFRGSIVALPINLLIAVGLLECLKFNGGPLIANSVSMILFSIIPFVFWFFKGIYRSTENA